MKLSTYKSETFQLFKLSSWKFQVSTIRPIETSICQIAIFNLSDRRTDTCNILTKWNFQFVNFKLFNFTNRQISVSQLQRFDKTQDSGFQIETLEFVTLSNWNIQLSAIWLNQTFNLWNRNISNRQIDQFRQSSNLPIRRYLLIYDEKDRFLRHIFEKKDPFLRPIFVDLRLIRRIDFWRTILDEKDRFLRPSFDKEDRFVFRKRSRKDGK